MAPKPDTKPVIDAVNDTISALTDLVRSLRHKAGKKGADMKTKAKSAANEVKRGAHEASADVGRTSQRLKARFQQAWHALTGENGATTSASSARGRTKSSRSTRRTSTRAAGRTRA